MHRFHAVSDGLDATQRQYGLPWGVDSTVGVLLDFDNRSLQLVVDGALMREFLV